MVGRNLLIVTPSGKGCRSAICSAGVIDPVDLRHLIDVSPVLPYPLQDNAEATRLGVVFADFQYTASNDRTPIHS